ncbi:glycine zipper domain-containing protein [Novosphingobium sp. FKTRR1]|uniref:glycine zipper domain-containing protein n=1 Tax=unclassified Novosphingobium TaxID=2644732 RepID=UPI001CF052C3|nr:glycine zipper domain-containing protein [Novosphingobium sp. FKTRR1]
MQHRWFIPLAAAGALALGGCASNYGGEGALAGGAGGAILGAATGGDPLAGAAVGAAIGGVGGSLIKKNGHCYRRNDRGREYRVRC